MWERHRELWNEPNQIGIIIGINIGVKSVEHFFPRLSDKRQKGVGKKYNTLCGVVYLFMISPFLLLYICRNNKKRREKKKHGKENVFYNVGFILYSLSVCTVSFLGFLNEKKSSSSQILTLLISTIQQKKNERKKRNAAWIHVNWEWSSLEIVYCVITGIGEIGNYAELCGFECNKQIKNKKKLVAEF